MVLSTQSFFAAGSSGALSESDASPLVWLPEDWICHCGLWWGLPHNDSDELQLGKNMGGSVDYTNRLMATLKTFPQKVNHSKPMILSQGTASSRNDSFFSVQSWMMADFTTSVPSGRGVQTLYWGADVDTLRFFKSFTKVKKSGKPGIFKAPSLALLKILLAMTSPTNEVSWEVWPPIIAKHVQDDIEVLRRVAKVGHKLLNDAGAGQVLAGECTQLEILCIYKKGREPFFVINVIC